MRASKSGQTKKSNRRKEENFLRMQFPDVDEETLQAFQEGFRRVCFELANEEAAKALSEKRDPLPPSEYLAGMAKIITPRGVNHILGRVQGVTLKVLWRLLRSDEGQRFFCCLLANLKTDWATKALRDTNLAVAEQKALEAQREVERLRAMQ